MYWATFYLQTKAPPTYKDQLQTLDGEHQSNCQLQEDQTSVAPSSALLGTATADPARAHQRQVGYANVMGGAMKSRSVVKVKLDLAPPPARAYVTRTLPCGAGTSAHLSPMLAPLVHKLLKLQVNRSPKYCPLHEYFLASPFPPQVSRLLTQTSI